MSVGQSKEKLRPSDKWRTLGAAVLKLGRVVGHAQ